MRIICPADKRIIELTFVAVATRLRHVVTAILLDQYAPETIGYSGPIQTTSQTYRTCLKIQKNLEKDSQRKFLTFFDNYVNFIILIEI